ncbi:MAG: hypothetical protein LBC48_02735 [Dysgonamonadaceae bacterium]|nr:hypothetical protein [Dysgonamonadaceae bacterium]
MIPKKWYGKKVEVIVFPIAEEAKQLIDNPNFRQLRKSVKKEEVLEIKKIFEKYLFPMNGFKFNRDEANNYE